MWFERCYRSWIHRRKNQQDRKTFCTSRCFAHRIKDLFNEKVVIIREDDYYKERNDLTYEERSKINYDHPFAFDHDLLRKDLNDLLNGKEIEKPTYDFTVHNRSDITEKIEPCRVIILEGLFVLEEESIRDLLDIKIFVDTPSDLRFIRRLVRDIKERKRDLDSVVSQYTTTVRPMHEQFIEPSKKYADIIIPEGGSNEVAIDLIASKITGILSEKLNH